MLLDYPIVNNEPSHNLKVYVYESLIPYLIIDNFYDEKELSLIWNELNFLLDGDKFNPPQKTGSATERGKPIKKNSGIFLDTLYTERKYSNILNVNGKFYQYFHDITSKCNSWWFASLRGSFSSIDKDSTLVSYYEDSDYYKAHWDHAVLTTLTWIYKEPKVFTGGDLFLNAECLSLSKPEIQHPLNLMGSPEKIEVKNNRMVVFPSIVPHQVNSVKIDPNYRNKGMGRFCISNFLNTSYT